MPRFVLSLPAEPDRENEDAAVPGADDDGGTGGVTGGGIGVVVDGAGLPKSVREGCVHSVAWYSHALADAFAAALRDEAVTMREALASAIATVTAAHAETCRLEAGSPSATVAAWRVAGPDVEYLVLCDASIVLGRADGSAEEITDDRVDTAVAAGATEALRARGRVEPFDAAELTAARYAALEATRNTGTGFWCCQSDPAAAAHALVGTVPLASLGSITAASDGATRGFQWLGAHPVERFAEFANAGRLAEIAREVRAAEDAAVLDPARAVKVHDDLTMVTLARLG